MICDLTARLPASSESLIAMIGGDGATTERRTRISRPDDGSAKCRGSRVRDQPSGSCPSTPPPTTPSTFSVISPPPARTEPSERRRCRSGVRSPPLRIDASRAARFAASVIRQCDKAMLAAEGCHLVHRRSKPARSRSSLRPEAGCGLPGWLMPRRCRR
jgi:hypothetical protein